MADDSLLTMSVAIVSTVCYARYESDNRGFPQGISIAGYRLDRQQLDAVRLSSPSNN